MEIELLTPADKPALIASSTATTIAQVTQTLTDLGYKVHLARDHPDFITRFSQAPYQVVVIDNDFAKTTEPASPTLQAIQVMPMNQRRHATFILISSALPSLHPMLAFQQSVHALVNQADLNRLGPIIQKVVADNDLFLSIFRDTQTRMAAGH